MSSQINAREICPYEKWCGGCTLQRMPYTEQLAHKQERVQELLGKYCEPEKIIGMNYPYYYRNKVHAVFGGSVRGRIICGTYERNSHAIVNIDACQIEDRLCDSIVASVRDLLPSFKIDPYNEDNGRGILRHVVVRRAAGTNQVMVILVTAGEIFPSKKNFAKALQQKHPEITTIIQNINDQDTSMVLGSRNEVIDGPGYIEDTLLGCRFRISPAAFYQVNGQQTKKLYRLAVEMADLQGGEKILDAYCGTGTIGITAACSVREKIFLAGVELNSDAVRDARTNARLNHLSGSRFIAADAGEFMQQEAAEGHGYDVVFMDPPRSGSSEAFLTSLMELAPERVVYVSCNPETQARDIASINKMYRVERVAPVDMFPFTDGIECVAKLVRK